MSQIREGKIALSVKAVIKKENITIFQVPKQCPNCKKPKRSFRGSICQICYGENVGNRIAWAKCPICSKDVAKLKESGACWDCDEKAEAGAKDHGGIKKKMLTIFKSQENIDRYCFKETITNILFMDALKVAEQFDPSKNNLYLWGETDCGKTHLAYCILNRWMMKGLNAEFYSMRALVNRFRMAPPEIEEARIRSMVTVPLLVIDDLGRIANSPFVLDILARILEERSMNRRDGLIVTSNLNIETLARQCNDDHVTSRLTGICNIVEVMTNYQYRSAMKVQ